MKIVSLAPAATEIVFALGLGDRLVAVTSECDHPPEAGSMPIVARSALPQGLPPSAAEIDRVVSERLAAGLPLLHVDHDLIRKLQPDLILAQGGGAAGSMGPRDDPLHGEFPDAARVLALDARSLDGVLESIRDVGAATDAEAAAADLVAALRARVDHVRRRAAGLPAVRALCLEWGDPPFAAGHWVAGMVEAAGGTPALASPGEPSRRIGWREIAAASPEVVVFMPCGFYLHEAEAEAAALFRNADFADTPAARTGLVFAADATSFFSRPGPRLVDGLEALAWALHPDAFPPPPRGWIAAVAPARRPPGL